MQHATERVERPGESQEALDRKKEHAGEWLQLPVIEMPPLQSKEPFSCRRIVATPRYPNATRIQKKSQRNFAVRLKAQMPCQRCANESHIPHLQEGVRKFEHPSHVHAWPLRKDDIHCNFRFGIFTFCQRQLMQNALNRWRPVDQANRPVLHLEVSQILST